MIKLLNKIPLDKRLHILAGAFVAILFAGVPVFFGYDVVMCIVLGIYMAAVAGILKELYDYFNPKKHTADFWDFVATVAGGILGAGVYWVFYILLLL